MLRIILIALLIYLAYKFIFHLVIPVYKTTKQVKNGFREMQEQMNEEMNRQQNGQPNSQPSEPPGFSKKEPAGDYFDFEEIKYQTSIYFSIFAARLGCF